MEWCRTRTRLSRDAVARWVPTELMSTPEKGTPDHDVMEHHGRSNTSKNVPAVGIHGFLSMIMGFCWQCRGLLGSHRLRKMVGMFWIKQTQSFDSGGCHQPCNNVRCAKGIVLLMMMEEQPEAACSCRVGRSEW